MSSSTKSVPGLKGGIGGGNGHAEDPKNVLNAAKKRLVQKSKLNIAFIKQRPKPTEGEAPKDDRIDGAEAIKYISEQASDAYAWVTETARPFLRTLKERVAKEGKEVMDDLCDDDAEQTNAERQNDYETGIEWLKQFGPDDDEIIREELQKFPKRRKFFENIFRRMTDIVELAILVDDIRYAEDKPTLEALLHSDKIAETKDEKVAEIHAFKRMYKLATPETFGAYHDFAIKKLAEATTSRSRELATAHTTELKQKVEEVSMKVETDISADELLFGDPTAAEEKTAYVSWTFQGHANGIRFARSGNRLYITAAIGRPADALTAMREEFNLGPNEHPFIAIEAIVDGDHLCKATMDDGKIVYDFDVFLKPSAFSMARWLRTACGICMPTRLYEDDAVALAMKEKASKKVESQQTKHTAPADNSGEEDISIEKFFFRQEGGAGTIVVHLPENFILHLDEVKDEKQEQVAPEREVVTTKPVAVKIRRKIVGGKSRISIIDVDNVEVMAELLINGIPNVEWMETGKKGWAGLPNPLPGILSYRFKVAKENNEFTSAKK